MSPVGSSRAVASAVVKLGGSIITDKAGGSLTVDEPLVLRVGREIAQNRPDRLVLVHGAGSFGHRIVQRTGIHLGLSSPESRLAMGETQRLQYELDARIAKLLLAAGLPVFPVQASASAVLDDGRLVHLDLTALPHLLDQGLVPLLYGVPAVDRQRGSAILSGDVLGPYVAAKLGFPLVIHATDVDGVYTRSPREDPSALRIPRVHRENWPEVKHHLGGSAAVDVTGGMATKLGELLRWAEQGVQSRILDARQPGGLAAALRGESVGTLVDWEAEPEAGRGS